MQAEIKGADQAANISAEELVLQVLKSCTDHMLAFAFVPSKSWRNYLLRAQCQQPGGQCGREHLMPAT